MKARWLMWVLWPAFLSASVAFALVFSLIDPGELRVFGRALELSREAVYTVAFLMAWTVCALSSALTVPVALPNGFPLSVASGPILTPE